jgi:hypothetical protein
LSYYSLAALRTSRIQALNKIFVKIDTLVKEFQNPGCARAYCDALVLGSFIKAAGKVKLWPSPQKFETRWLVESIQEVAVGLRIESVCRPHHHPKCPAKGHIVEEIKRVANDIRNELTGLTLADFNTTKNA